jgi:hypothetical protein
MLHDSTDDEEEVAENSGGEAFGQQQVSPIHNSIFQIKISLIY